MEVYERPANKFVAGFLGTPPMNFFTGCLKFKNDTACLVIGNDNIILPQRLRTVLSNYCDKEMVLGVRPENISPNQFLGQADNTISATVSVIEPVGNRKDVCLTNHAGGKFIASIDPRIRIKANDAVKMCIDLERIHIFESGEAGRNVALSDSISAQPD
jgi:multiple sugar transport system ATP-binding protein